MPNNNDPFELKIQGAAVIPHPAERALINVHVSSEGTNKASIADEVITTSKHIEALLRAIAPQDASAAASAASPLAHWNKTSLISRSWTPEQVPASPTTKLYSATVKYDIRFKEFKALGSFGTRIAAMPHVVINEIDWILTTATEESYAPRLRQACARDAMAKARHYCEILGCTDLRPVALSEDNYYSHGERSFRKEHIATQHQRAMGETHGTHDSPDELEFRPQEVKMKKTVTIKFHAE